jgi:regulator of sigma E protease
MYWGDIQAGLIEPSEIAHRRDDPLPVTVAVLRGGERLELQVVPRFDADAGYWVLGLEPWDTVVGLVQKGGPGDKLGLEPGDEILAIDGYEVTSFNDIATVINRNGGREVVVKWRRDGQEISGRVVPLEAEILPDSTIGRIYIDRQYVARDVNLGQALWVGMRATWATMQATLNVLYRFVGGKLGLEAVGGPIRIGQVAGEMLRWSFGHLMQFIAFFSVNLFLLNLLPIPVLDGGHVLFLMFEAIRGKPAPERMQAIATQMGLIILLLFMTFVLVFDVWKVTGH